MDDQDTPPHERFSQMGKLGGPARWKGIPREERAAALAPARRGRRTNEERFRALTEQLEELRAKVVDLEQRVAA
ncbi:hypothetical protein ACFFX1_54770 [Dactylosporangium sucinum]|uniref:Uncharacterized protein n=1 Tax=Dactylosporangium sucinum TaxID=1424081 RepID=A0A917U2X9_9ACTN|nr:hypothetical protein [Dactylosporangium sucinum]GGM53643.1 hypothetical protein GCM10007977_064030 [Dactylosporangium sucinum]